MGRDRPSAWKRSIGGEKRRWILTTFVIGGVIAYQMSGHGSAPVDMQDPTAVTATQVVNVHRLGPVLELRETCTDDRVCSTMAFELGEHYAVEIRRECDGKPHGEHAVYWTQQQERFAQGKYLTAAELEDLTFTPVEMYGLSLGTTQAEVTKAAQSRSKETGAPVVQSNWDMRGNSLSERDARLIAPKSQLDSC